LTVVYVAESGEALMRLAAALAGFWAAVGIAPWGDAAPIGSAALPAWRVPDIGALPDNENRRMVRYGRDLIEHTSALIGPDAADRAMRFAGNGLECQNCHLDAATARFALPLVGIWGLYPGFSARADEVQTMADRINDCMLRSMNSRPLPPYRREMKAIEAYIRFLGSDHPDRSVPVGRGAPRLPLPQNAADPVHGAAVYDRYCAACHGSDGSGVRNAPLAAKRKQQRYLFPPLWGPDSYNNGAGMARNISAAWFVHANMPRGITFADPMLKPSEAYDVAAYINEQPRPQKAGLAHDYPDAWLKPADAAFPPVLGPFSLQQREFGPWPPIDAWLGANMPKTVKGPRSADEVETMAEIKPVNRK
jgi:thiosulfate dehydrogenase